ncbi:chitin synthase chs-1-like [Mastacembelus armatus]|uniref:chitin synthase chs-1-like n=1 Tax=Mastacembelus armatus TaxID=205130 RepID=UPI000E4552FE|nr:chitin synthase chs-1-like [Mastacembelus armatus]
MNEERSSPKRLWDTFREVPVIEDEQTPWKQIKLLKIITLFVVAVVVFGLALCSKVSFLLLITLSNEGTKTIPAEQKPVALLCVGCCLVASSVLLLQKSIWKACYKSSKVPAKKTVALVLFFEFMASLGAAILTIVAMPHLDIVTNVMILNSVAVVSALLQVSTQCTARERNRFLLPSITSMVLIILGFVLFCFLYIMKDPANTKMIIWVGLAVGGAFLVSFNWWETYFRLIGENSSSIFLKNLCKDMTKCQNVLHILSSLLRIAVTACVLGAYVPLAKMDWDIVKSIPSRETRIIVITVGVQLMSSALCHWFALAACKMHALRRCFILPLYLASLAVMALLIIPVIVYYQDYRVKLNGTASINFTGYCNVAVDGRTLNQNSSVFPELVLDVTHTLCFLDMSKVTDIGILTGSAASWWLGLVFATFHLWYLSIYRIQRTQDLFIRRFYEGGFLEQSLLLNTRFDIQTTRKWKQFKPLDPVKVFLCATMWHETYDEMMKIIISIFRLDRYRPRKKAETSDMTFEGHVYFDDAFRDVPGSRGRHVNEYAEMLVEIIKEVYSIFLNMDKGIFSNQQQIPDQRIVRTPYGGRVVVTMPYGNSLVVHFKDRKLIRHKKRWSQVMYLYYLLGWKVATKYYKRWESGEDEAKLTGELQKEKHNTYLLALDGDTDFHPAAVMLLIDRLQLYPRVGAACGRIHPTGSGPMVWYQKFEYAVGHWLHKTAEHVFGCVLCSPGCFSLFRADALMDDNVMKKYTIKASEARHYIQYDQGEDRWLCTLLLKQGWRVEYVAASDAYTNAPEEFKEFYNQRRRWGPSTMANIVDLLGSSNLIINKNPSMSTPYMLYQLFCLTSSILAPSTVVLMIAGSLTVLLNIHPNAALVLAVIPPAIFLGVSFKVKADTQILIAAVMSVLYAFIMMIAALIIIGNMIKDKTILTPSSIFIIFLAGFYLLTAVMHPQEISLVVHGWLYMLSIPSAYLLLAIYSMVNMNNVSWGTRETTPAAGPAKPVAAAPQTQAQKVKNTFKRLLTRIQCCKETYRTGSEASVSQQNLTDEPEESVPQPQNTIVEDESRPEEEERQEEPAFTCPNQCWVTQLQSLSDDMPLQEDTLDQDEELFFRELTAKYLEPLPEDKNKQKKVTENLKELRNKITFVYFLCNAFWLVATFCLQLIGGSVFIQVPKLDMHLQLTGEYIYIDPLGFMFILAFATLIIVQFFAMLYHRIYTLIHFVSFLDTESKFEKKRQQVKKVQNDDNVKTDKVNDDEVNDHEVNDDEVNDDEVSDDEASDDEVSEVHMFPGLLNRIYDRGAMV